MAGAPVDGIVHPPAALLHANAAPLRVSQQPPLGCSLGNVLGQDDVTARRRERACELTCSSSSEHATDARARAGVRGAGAAPVLEVVVRILLRVLDLLAHGGTRRRLSGSNRSFTFLFTALRGVNKSTTARWGSLFSLNAWESALPAARRPPQTGPLIKTGGVLPLFLSTPVSSAEHILLDQWITSSAQTMAKIAGAPRDP